ncbi:DUF1284 domain-containing protein [Paenibacillus sedimenti]|uniref:DUF1284 domain-containing protein n=1 Tax=Paenibacillus sedimenti TaxID=2770274 RepID=A0A926QHE5_9BACL|nr:DUF1284 domain-containing protein [Paenibacillus sedimenti]MBD0379420.1 DUF1284 domain-containing protein [Paenibacillus sedimenti]
MTIGLRGHHLFCLLGYRGMGYSKEFCENMTSVYETLRSKPDTIIRIVLGPDDLCAAYPADQVSHCEGRTVYQRDAEIVEKLGLQVGMELSWADICNQVAERVAPGDIGHLCATCRWQPYGVCEEGVRIIVDGGSLPPVPSKQKDPRLNTNADPL